MIKVAIIGDTHSDGTFVANVHRHLRTFHEDCHTIVQLGDFGYTFDKAMIDSITAWLARDERNEWFWLDGNHDEHNYIDLLTQEFGYSDPIDMGGMKTGKVEFPERLYYCPRGSTTVLGDTLCVFMGGAYSIDKAYRQEHISWWPQELITEADIQRAANVGDVDVVFSHDMPIVPEFEEMLNNVGYKVGPQSYHNREAMNAVCREVQPDHLYHGHYHYRHDGVHTTSNGWPVEVHGVGANVSDRGYIDHAVYPERNLLIREF